MSKDKKKKKDGKKKEKKGAGAAKVAQTLKALSENRLVADVVAAALVATASALKDSKKARQLASDAGDELTKLSKEGARAGNALWDMALEIGRQSLEALSGEEAPKRAPAKSRARKSVAKKRPSARTSR